MDGTTPECIASDAKNGTWAAADTERQFQSWLRFYHEEFGLEFEDATEITVPPRQPGFNWLVVVPRGIELSQVLEACRKRFPVVVRGYNDIVSAVLEEARSNSEHGYAVWIKHRQITDKNMLGLSVENIEDYGIPTIRLLEYLLVALKFFVETMDDDGAGKYLDPTLSTLCAGTRLEGDRFPTVAWMRKEGVYLVQQVGYVGSRHFIAPRQVIEAAAA